MPVQVSYPGVYIQEVSSGVRTINGVSTSVALFVGMTQRGPLNSARSLLSFAAYERSYGDDTTVSEMTDQVRQFFLNGGRQAYIIRIADEGTATAAEATVQSEGGADVLRIYAAEAGLIGESIRVEVDYDTAQPETTFNLTAARETVDATGTVVLVETETLTELSMDPNSSRYVVDALEQGSALIRAEDVAAIAPMAGYSMSGRGEDDWLAALNAQLATQSNTGSFQISVDGGPAAPVTLNGPLAAIGDVQSAIDTALGGGQATVTTPTLGAGPEEVLLVQSNDTGGGSVRILSGLAGDLAAPMHLGTSNDGLEVGGYAALRPAPTGVFMGLGDISPSAGVNWLDRLVTLARTAPAGFPDLTITTSQRADTYTISGIAAATLWEASPAAGTSLRNLRTSLQAIVSAVAGTSGANYDAGLQGFRLVLTADFSSNTEQETAVASTSGGYLVADVNTGIFGIDPNVRRLPLGSYGTPSNYVTGTGGGADGDMPGLDDYTRAYRIAARDIDIFNLLMLPRVLSDGSGNAQGDTQRTPLWGPASAFCRDQRAFLVIDPRDDWTDAASAVSGISNIRTGAVGDHAMVAWPRLRVTDAQSGLLKTIDPAGSIAGVAARIDGSRGVWKAPAGLEASILGIRGTQYMISDAENGQLNPQAINAIRRFPNGIVIWGSRTLAGYDNSGENDYRYVPIRRAALFIEESLYRGLQFAVFEPNDEPLWAQIRLAAGAFMNGLFRRGAFQGSKASDAYFVKCDSETTTQNDINLGIVNVVIGFAPLRPAEFVVVTIRQLAGQVQT